jgi:hypothetical protein
MTTIATMQKMVGFDVRKGRKSPQVQCFLTRRVTTIVIVSIKKGEGLHLEKRMTHFMCLDKSMEDGVKNMMEVMTRAGVQHQAQMNVMSELYGGHHKWTFTELDMRNRYDQS